MGLNSSPKREECPTQPFGVEWPCGLRREAGEGVSHMDPVPPGGQIETLAS